MGVCCDVTVFENHIAGDDVVVAEGNSRGYTGGTPSTEFKATWYPGLFPPLPFLREKSWARGSFKRDVLQEFTFGDKGSNQRCSFSQKRKNTLNHRYLETNAKPLVSVRKLHKHRRS